MTNEKSPMTAERALAEYMDAHPWGKWEKDADYMTCDFCGMGDNEPEHIHHSEDCPVLILWRAVRSSPADTKSGAVEVTEDCWPHAIRFLCKLYTDIDAFVYANCDGDALMKYPVVQGTRNQMTLHKLGQQPYDAAKVMETLTAMRAALEAYEAQRGGK